MEKSRDATTPPLDQVICKNDDTHVGDTFALDYSTFPYGIINPPQHSNIYPENCIFFLIKKSSVCFKFFHTLFANLRKNGIYSFFDEQLEVC